MLNLTAHNTVLNSLVRTAALDSLALTAVGISETPCHFYHTGILTEAEAVGVIFAFQPEVLAFSIAKKYDQGKDETLVNWAKWVSLVVANLTVKENPALITEEVSLVRELLMGSQKLTFFTSFARLSAIYRVLTTDYTLGEFITDFDLGNGFKEEKDFINNA